MTDYIPMQGPFPGVQWKPYNGSVGDAFISDWCGNCARDDSGTCQILAASFRGEAVEWRSTDEGQLCVAYVEAGQPIPLPRDDRTVDMFGENP